MTTLYIRTRTVLMDFINYGLAHHLFGNFNVRSFGLNSDLETIYKVEFKDYIEEIDTYYIYTFERPLNKQYIYLEQPELEPLPF
jgi:hypothetical protein